MQNVGLNSTLKCNPSCKSSLANHLQWCIRLGFSSKARDVSKRRKSARAAASTAWSFPNTGSPENKGHANEDEPFSLLQWIRMTRLPELGSMPPIAGIETWLHTDAPLTKEDLLGSVVLLEFMTFSCVNCLRTFPSLARWHETYEEKGLRIIGIHTPEFAFEHDARAVEEALKKHRIAFPVALDNDYVTWRNFQNRYWPATYLFDAKERLRYTHIGEGGYRETEAAIRSLLKESGAVFERGRLAKDGAAPHGTGGEIYLGYAKPGSLASPEKVRRGDVQTYSLPDSLEMGIPALEGRWRVEGERIVSEEKGARVIVKVSTEDVRAVITPPEGASATCRMRLGGKVPGKRLRGEDLVERNGETYLVVDRPRSFRILSGGGAEDVLELTCLNKGTSLYAVTF